MSNPGTSTAPSTPSASPAADAPAPVAGGADAPAFQAITSQADLDRIIGERLGRERAKFADYEDLKAKASQFDQAQDAAKTDLQKAQERAEKLEAQLQEATVKDLRATAAASHGLPASASGFVQGTTPEEADASAKALADLLKGAGPAAPVLRSSGSTSTTTSSDPKRQAVRDLFG